MIFGHVPKILLANFWKFQSFNYPKEPGNETQSPDFGNFLMIFGIFQAVRFGTSLWLRTMIYYKNLVYVLSRAIKYFFFLLII